MALRDLTTIYPPTCETGSYYNQTASQCVNNTNSTGNGTMVWTGGLYLDAWTVIFAAVYSLICIVGCVGNGLVIFVVLRYTKMKTVTNMYILNLAFADLCFLVGMPFLIATSMLKTWVFGFLLCKLFYILTSINWFTSVFTLTVMSADRYMAVCHPVRSMKYRTPFVSRLVCICVWTASILVMFPIVLYATTVTSEDGRESCTILWPEGQPIPADMAFIWYALLLGYAIPVALISVFYALVVVRLKTVGPKKKSKEKKKSHRKVTTLVLIVITVYVICWLPYWAFQVALTFASTDVSRGIITLFQIFTLMSYANSMLNPLIYAFLSENFRKSFIKAFKCATPSEVNGALHAENSVFPGKKSTVSTANRTTKLTHANSDEELELATTNMSTTCTTKAEPDPVNSIYATDYNAIKDNANAKPTMV